MIEDENKPFFDINNIFDLSDDDQWIDKFVKDAQDQKLITGSISPNKPSSGVSVQLPGYTLEFENTFVPSTFGSNNTNNANKKAVGYYDVVVGNTNQLFSIVYQKDSAISVITPLSNSADVIQQACNEFTEQIKARFMRTEPKVRLDDKYVVVFDKLVFDHNGAGKISLKVGCAVDNNFLEAENLGIVNPALETLNALGREYLFFITGEFEIDEPAKITAMVINTLEYCKRDKTGKPAVLFAV